MKSIGVGVALVGAVVMLPGNGWAQCPLPTPVSFDEAAVVPIPDAASCTPPAGSGAPVDRTIVVSGLANFLTDVDLRLNVVHQCPSDLQASLTSPQGTILSLTTNPPSDCNNENLFAGTTFDDDADPAGSVPYNFNNRLASDLDPTLSSTALFVVPEEALAAVRGENPNGAWTLRLVDTCNGSVGTLNNWGLDIAALSGAPTQSSQTFTQTGPVPIPDAGVLVSALSTSAVDLGTFLTRVEVATSIDHAFPAELQFALRSPEGTEVTLSTFNGIDPNTFNPTVWDDRVNPAGQVPYANNAGLASDHPYGASNVLALVPEESLGAFYGEDPDGTWSLTIADTVASGGVGGSLNDWSLVLTTGVCATPTPGGPTVTPGGPTPTPTPTITPGGPTLTPTPTVTPGGPTLTPTAAGGGPTPTPTIPPVICNGLPATIVGTAGNDLIIGTSTDDVIHGLAGNDIIKGRQGSDMICGGGGNDVLRGNKDDDLIKGGTGSDELRGGGARDVLLGGRGNDFLDGGDEDDTCIDNKGSNALVNCEGP